MTTAQNKKLVEKYFDACSRGDSWVISDMYAPEGVHIVLGNTLLSTTYTKKQMFEVSGQVMNYFPEGLRYTVDNMVAENDTVVAEVRCDGKHVSGVQYHNEYAFIMKFRDGEIIESKEYFDTEAATEVLCGGNRPPR